MEVSPDAWPRNAPSLKRHVVGIILPDIFFITRPWLLASTLNPAVILQVSQVVLAKDNKGQIDPWASPWYSLEIKQARAGGLDVGGPTHIRGT